MSPAFAQDETQDSLRVPQLKSFRIYKSLHVALMLPADSVVRLDLSHQKLKALPEEIVKLTALRELIVSKNRLHELPGWIGQMKQLQVFDASNNKLKALPPSIGELTNLVELKLNRNLIEALPYQVGKLKNLQVLEMWDNELGVVPEEMKDLHNLRVFELRGILFNEEEQQQIANLLPDTKIYFSPSCNCKN